MGGVGFVITILVLTLILINLEFQPSFLALIVLILAYALIGLADDLIKIGRQRNLGLTFWQKLACQVMAAGGFAIWLTLIGHNLGVTGLLARLGLYSAFVYPLFVTLVIVSAANAANLTDGLNGLLAGTAGIAFLVLAYLAARAGAGEALTFAVVAAGAVLAFLYFNFPRARVFMGDSGALALGAALGGLAVILHKELLLIIIGGVLVIETLSVIIQVVSYKIFRRRVFEMTPLHHTFELMGLSEPVVVVLFWLAAVIFGAIGIWI